MQKSDEKHSIGLLQTYHNFRAISVGLIYQIQKWKLNIASLISVGGAVVENLPADLEDTRDMGSVSPWVGKILWSRKWQPLHYLSWKILWTEDTGGL